MQALFSLCTQLLQTVILAVHTSFGSRYRKLCTFKCTQPPKVALTLFGCVQSRIHFFADSPMYTGLGHPPATTHNSLVEPTHADLTHRLSDLNDLTEQGCKIAGPYTLLFPFFGCHSSVLPYHTWLHESLCQVKTNQNNILSFSAIVCSFLCLNHPFIITCV